MGNKTYNGGFKASTGFQRQNPSPLDDSNFVQTSDDLKTLANCYSGIEVRVSDQANKKYVWNGNDQTNLDNWVADNLFSDIHADKLSSIMNQQVLNPVAVGTDLHQVTPLIKLYENEFMSLLPTNDLNKFQINLSNTASNYRLFAVIITEGSNDHILKINGWNGLKIVNNWSNVITDDTNEFQIFGGVNAPDITFHYVSILIIDVNGTSICHIDYESKITA